MHDIRPVIRSRDHERAAEAGVSPGGRRNDLNADIGPHRHVRHLGQLVVGDLRRPDESVQHGLVQNHPQVGWFRPVENALPPRPGRRPGRPPLISREQVLACALQIVDRDGLTALTMRRLGTELGVDPMAVYRHVSGKSALYDGVVECVFAEVAIPPRGGDWAEDLEAIARALRTTLLTHPNAVPLLGTRPPTTPACFRIIEAAVTVLLDAGFSPQDAADGVDCTGRLVIGHVLAQTGLPPGGDVDGGEAEHRQTQQALTPAQSPGLAAVTRAGARHDPERLFELGMEGIRLTLASQLQHKPWQ